MCIISLESILPIHPIENRDTSANHSCTGVPAVRFVIPSPSLLFPIRQLCEPYPRVFASNLRKVYN